MLKKSAYPKNYFLELSLSFVWAFLFFFFLLNLVGHLLLHARVVSFFLATYMQGRFLSFNAFLFKLRLENIKIRVNFYPKKKKKKKK